MEIEYISSTWEYDGSFSGFLTLVYQAFSRRQFPDTIIVTGTDPQTLFSTEWIETNKPIADKVLKRLNERIVQKNLAFIRDGFNTMLQNKERYLLTALKIALESRETLLHFIGDPAILMLKKKIASLKREAHSYTGFIRFEEIDNVLFGKIAPKYQVLPYICPHFARRYPKEDLIIYDETHHILVHIFENKTTFLYDTVCPNFIPNAQEKEFQKNWRTFNDSVTITERINLKTQLSHLPKRFRAWMHEFEENHNA